tara:strand:+ start:1840 stop:2895 length:1056 start_codon:yes stop_codon:yes gene_type:complete
MPFAIETVESGRVGQFPSLINYDDAPAIVYGGAGNESVRFARLIDGVWITSHVANLQHGVLGSIDAEDSLNESPIVVYIDRPKNLSTTSISQIKYGSFDGTIWNIETVDTDSFSQRFFHNAKIVKTSRGSILGWVERDVQGVYKIVTSQKGSNGWNSFAIGATSSRSSWDMARIGDNLAIVYFDLSARAVKYAERTMRGSWGTPETAVQVAGTHSVLGISLIDLNGDAQISYQVNLGNSNLPGAQRRLTKSSGSWVEDVVDQNFTTSGFVDSASSINQNGFLAIAYHRRRDNVVNYATLLDESEYNLSMWAIEEVGRDLAMPSLKYINLVTYIAVHDVRTQSVAFAEEVIA